MDQGVSRLESVERGLAALAERVAVLEGRAPAARETAVRGWPVPAAAAVRTDWESLVGGRLLGLAGGGAVLVGVGLLVAMAAERGLLGEGARVALALAGSLALLGAGVWLHERRGRTQASLAAVGTGVAALYLTLTAASALYRLVPVTFALALAVLIGVLATVLAVRWEATAVAGLGILGALAAPVLVGAPARAGTLAFLLVAHAAAVAVLVWRGWDWLGTGAFGVVTAQVTAWAVGAPPTASLVTVLALFGALNLVGAVGFAVRRRGAALGHASIMLAASSAVVTGGLGVVVLGADTGGRWLAVLAVVHGCLGLAVAGRDRGVARLLCALAVLLGDAAFALLADGPVLAVGWAASAALLAAAGRADPRDAAVVRVGIKIQLSLAGAHALLVQAPPTALLDGVEDLLGAAVALAATAGAAWCCRRLAPLGGVAAAVVVYLVSVAIVTLTGGQDGQVLVSGLWSVCGVAALWVGLRRDESGWRRAGFALMALATAKVALYDLAALEQAYRSVSTIALGLLLLCGAYVYQRLRSTTVG